VLSSRPVEQVLDEIRRLTGNGHREIVLAGVHLGHYGLDRPARPDDPARDHLAGLVAKIVELPGEFRVRLSSLEAVEARGELLAVMRANPRRVCPHLHLSMQSGSDAVLARMQRRWQSSRFVERCVEARAALGNPALTTDVIVGFPGETEDDFQATCRVCEAVGFAKIHIFRFSPRQGTPAADMPGQVQDRIKHGRAMRLGELGRRLRQQYLDSLRGHRLQVLVESPVAGKPGWVHGLAGQYVRVELPGDERLVNQLVEVEYEREGGAWKGE
jgi:threonylcarbamoyladenosine tRNA methylthiotransferase MtaB